MNDFDSIRMTYKRGKTARDANEKRRLNIETFSQLERTDLNFGRVERRLLLYTTDVGERIFIQYPGKETISNNPEKVRPWDFRPKLQLANGEHMKDLSFPNIWDDLANMHAEDEQVLSVLAAVFFRMAYMVDYVVEKRKYAFIDIDMVSGAEINSGEIEIEWIRPNFSKDIYTYLNNSIFEIRGVSIEAYLFYNDLLVQNEDCKYYYRDTVVRNGAWKSPAGRCNTLRTHISVIEYFQGKISFSQIMGRFQGGSGVAPVGIGRISDITNNLIMQ